MAEVISNFWTRLNQYKNMTEDDKAAAGFDSINEASYEFKLQKSVPHISGRSSSRGKKEKKRIVKCIIVVNCFQLIEGENVKLTCLHEESCASLISSLNNNYELKTGDEHLVGLIRNAGIRPSTMAYKDIGTRKLMVPNNMHTAVKIVQLFFNGISSPLSKIEGMAADFTLEQDKTTILFTYFASCMSVALNVEALAICHNIKQTVQIHNYLTIFREEKRAEMESKALAADIDKSVLFFHALFFCYAICRPVPSSDKFPLWARKRFNALAAALSMPPKPDITLDLRTSGETLMRIAAERRDVKTAALFAIHLAMNQDSNSDSSALTLAEHVKMLTMFAGSSTLNFIMQLLNRGGAALALEPIFNQLKTYATERSTAIKQLKSIGITETTAWLPYFKILFPESQLFTATKYSDIITAVCAMDQKLHGVNSTMKDFQYNKNLGVLDKGSLVTFLDQCRELVGLGKVISKRQAKLLGSHLGISNFDELVMEARSAMNSLSTKRGGQRIYDPNDSGNESGDEDNNDLQAGASTSQGHPAPQISGLPIHSAPVHHLVHQPSSQAGPSSSTSASQPTGEEQGTPDEPTQGETIDTQQSSESDSDDDENKGK